MFGQLNFFFVFSRSTDVKRHMTKHTGEKPYCCSICNASFTQSGSLATHMKQHNEYKVDPEEKTQKKKKTRTEKPYLCSICGKSFKQSSVLTIHIRRHVGDKPYSCKYCDLRYVLLDVLFYCF